MCLDVCHHAHLQHLRSLPGRESQSLDRDGGWWIGGAAPGRGERQTVVSRILTKQHSTYSTIVTVQSCELFIIYCSIFFTSMLLFKNADLVWKHVNSKTYSNINIVSLCKKRKVFEFLLSHDKKNGIRQATQADRQTCKGNLCCVPCSGKRPCF